MKTRQAIIMAGGRSERMRAGGDATHKALLRVAGATMIERNLAALLDRGFSEITVAVSAREAVLAEFCRTRLIPAARHGRADLRVFIEEAPLGTIGAARHGFADESEPLLVLNVDNLADLDLSALYDDHRVNAPWMTVATHEEPFRIPFGEVVEENSTIKEYREKPVVRIVVSSGTYVLSHSAAALIGRDEAIGADALVRRVLERGAVVRSFRHAGRWIDVNDPQSLAHARELFDDGPARSA